METRLAQWVQDSPDGATADHILRACVHCGFCLATCPTYQVLGDELDSPRGRIYQIKQVLEGTAPSRTHQLHLDRCLTCRSCETTCPSGVEFGHLLDVGRTAVDERVTRPWVHRASRWLLREGLTRRRMFGTVLLASRALARLIPFTLGARLRAKLGTPRPAGARPNTEHSRKVLMPLGCTQPSMLPSIDGATSRVLDAIGIQPIIVARSGCCGAIRHHLGDPAGALTEARHNIDTWWPDVESGKVEAILINASGCGAMVRDYAHLLRHDPAYAQKAARIAELTRDPAELVSASLDRLKEKLAAAGQAPTRVQHRIAFHAPCTLQHALRIRGAVETVLMGLGAELVPVPEPHLCCGSAGTYSLLQPRISNTLRTRKLDALLQRAPQLVLSANIGCIAHLQSGTQTPVRHWLEWLDERLHA